MGKSSAETMLLDFIDSHKKIGKVQERILAIERIRNYINYENGQAYKNDIAIIQGEKDKCKKYCKKGLGMILLSAALFIVDLILMDFLESSTLLEDNSNKFMLFMVLLLSVICHLFSSIVGPIIACVMFVKGGKIKNKAEKMQMNIHAYLVQEKQFVCENNNHYQDAISGVDLRPLKSYVGTLKSHIFSLKLDLAKEAHCDVSYITRHEGQRAINAANDVLSKMSKYDISFAEAYRMYVKEKDELDEIEMRVEERRRQKQEYREMSRQIQSLQEAVEQNNRDADRRYRDAQLREDIRDILRR